MDLYDEAFQKISFGVDNLISCTDGILKSRIEELREMVGRLQAIRNLVTGD